MKHSLSSIYIKVGKALQHSTNCNIKLSGGRSEETVRQPKADEWVHKKITMYRHRSSVSVNIHYLLYWYKLLRGETFPFSRFLALFAKLNLLASKFAKIYFTRNEEKWESRKLNRGEKNTVFEYFYFSCYLYEINLY